METQYEPKRRAENFPKLRQSRRQTAVQEHNLHCIQRFPSSTGHYKNLIT